MLNEKIQDVLNSQINLEQYSAQLYLAMSAHCESKSFRGIAHWLRVQAQEETAHAMKLVAFVLDRGGRLELKAIDAPPRDFGNVDPSIRENSRSRAKNHDQYQYAVRTLAPRKGLRERNHAAMVRL